MSEIHKVVSEIHKVVSQIHKVVSQIHKVVSQIHQVVSQIHKVVSQIHKVVSQIHKVVSQIHKVVSQIHKVVSQIHKVVSQIHKVPRFYAPVHNFPLPTSAVGRRFASLNPTAASNIFWSNFADTGPRNSIRLSNWCAMCWKAISKIILKSFSISAEILSKFVIHRAANQYGISIFCTDFTCKIREYEFGLENTEIELCQFCHLKYCCQNKAYLFWVANQSGFVAFYALEPSNTSLINKTFNLLSFTCSNNMLSCLTSCSCSTGSIH